MYPSIEKKPQARSSRTGNLRRSRTSNGCIGGRIIWFLVRIKHVAMIFMDPDSKPMIRSDHASERLSIMGCVANDTTTPPSPDPALVRLFARLLFLSNHWLVTATLGMKMKPTPKPTHAPWLRYRCHIFVAKLAAMKPDVCSRTPSSITRCVPNVRTR
jgi:hypothetical protein